jgi:hypothetical protein
MEKKMVFVKRCKDGKVTGIYNSHQPEIDLEKISEDDKDVIAFKNPPETYIQKRLKSMDEGGYGTNGERWSYIYDNGFDKLKEYDKGVKSRFPKK